MLPVNNRTFSSYGLNITDENQPLLRVTRATKQQDLRHAVLESSKKTNSTVSKVIKIPKVSNIHFFIFIIYFSRAAVIFFTTARRSCPSC